MRPIAAHRQLCGNRVADTEVDGETKGGRVALRVTVRCQISTIFLSGLLIAFTDVLRRSLTTASSVRS